MTTYLPYWTSKKNSGEYKNFEGFKMCFEMTIDTQQEKYGIVLDTKVDIIDGVFIGSVSLVSLQMLADKGHYVSKVILEKFNKGELKSVSTNLKTLSAKELAQLFIDVRSELIDRTYASHTDKSADLQLLLYATGSKLQQKLDLIAKFDDKSIIG